MKKLLSITVMLLTMVSIIFAATQRETYYVVQQTNFLKDKGYKVYDASEYKELQNQVKLEKRYFRPALKEAQNKWNDEQQKLVDAGEKKMSFPVSAISPRTMMLKGKYTNQEKADDKLSKLEGAEYDKLYGKDKKKKSGYKKPKKSEEDQLKDEKKRLVGVEAGKKFQKFYSEYLKEKTGQEAPVYIEHVELTRRH
jgi:hypothetical protein